MKNIAGNPANIAKHILLLAGAVIMVLPYVWMVSTSLKPSHEVLSWPPQLIFKTVTLKNYVTGFQTTPFGRFFISRMLRASVSTISILITSSLTHKERCVLLLNASPSDVEMVATLLAGSLPLVTSFHYYDNADWLLRFQPS
ncbi:MAG: hypothetical protein WC182_04295 [Bacilli bacterium]|jgi:multiple sugar transport system permease protein